MKNKPTNRDGLHLNSKYWQEWRKSRPGISNLIKQVAIVMVLSDCMTRVSHEAYIKFEQGYQQKPFVDHLFEMFKEYCWMTSPGIYVAKNGPRQGQIKSYWFKTFTHYSFSNIWEILYINGKKHIQPGLILNNLSPMGLAYWIMSDGSLQNDYKSLILHTQSYGLFFVLGLFLKRQRKDLNRGAFFCLRSFLEKTKKRPKPGPPKMKMKY